MYTHLVCGGKVQCANTHQNEKPVEVSQECRIFGSLNLTFFIPELVFEHIWLNICL